MKTSNAILIASAALGLSLTVPAEARDHHYGGGNWNHGHRSYYQHSPRYYSGYSYYRPRVYNRPSVAYFAPPSYYYDDYPYYGGYPVYGYYSRPRTAVTFSFGGGYSHHYHHR